jgi:hypothetical protein
MSTLFANPLICCSASHWAAGGERYERFDTARAIQNSDGSFSVFVATFVLDRFDPQKGGAEENCRNFATAALWADYYNISIGFSTTTNVPATAARTSRGD